MILCWAAFTAILGRLWPAGHRLDTPASNFSLPILLGLGNRHFTFCLDEFEYSRDFTEVASYGIYPWLVSLSVMSSRLTCVVTCVRKPALFAARWYSIVSPHCIWFIHSPVDGHVGSFHLPAIVNNAVMNTGIQAPVLITIP